MPGSFAQRLANTLMIPILLIPVAAGLQGLGFILGAPALTEAGRALLVHYLPLVFALGVAIGFAGGEAMALLAAAAGYAVTVKVAALTIGNAEIVLAGLSAPVPLARDLNLGALGGILSGAVSIWLWHRFRAVRLPEVLALFSGPRLVPTVAAAAGVPVGMLIGAVWPAVMGGIAAVGSWAVSAGALGAFVYGAVLRILVPTGLHHIVNNLVEYQLGAYADPQTGTVVTGEIQRFLHGDPRAGLLMSGFFILMMFCIPAIALALAHAAQPEERRRVSGLMTTGALTSIITGITEPVEFAFVFSAPVLWVFHAVMQGAVSAAAYALGIRHWGYALPLYVLNLGASTRAWLIIPLGVGFGFLYYAAFRLALRYGRWPVLGREAGTGGTLGASTGRSPPGEREGAAPGAAAKRTRTGGRGDALMLEARQILAALGGRGNVRSAAACMSRLRLELVDVGAADEAALRRIGAAGVVHLGGGALQVVFGPRSQELCDGLHRLLVAPGAAPLPDTGAAEAIADAPANSGLAAPTGAGGPRPVPELAVVELIAPLSGNVVPLSEVGDPVFAAGLAGDGVAILPSENRLLAPCDGRVLHVFPGGHAVGLVGPGGVEILLHLGVDTVHLRGQGFSPEVQEGDLVQCGQELVRFAPETILESGHSLVTPVLVTNMERVARIEFSRDAQVVAGQSVLMRVALRS